MIDVPDIHDMKVTVRGRGRPKVVSDAAQAAQIVETARRLFLLQGYARTTMDDVAARCHASKRTLYRHFPGKAELLAAVIDLHRTSMLALPGDYDNLPLAVALEKIFVIDIDETGDAERRAFLRLMLIEAVQRPEVGELLHRRGVDASKTLLAEWLQDRKDRDHLRIDSASDAAQILMDMVFGPVALNRSLGQDPGPDWPGQAERKRHLRTCIRIFVYGVAAPARDAGPRDPKRIGL